MMMYCWRAAHFWTLNVQKAGTADWVHNDVTATVVGPALTASADGPLGTDSGSVFGGSSYVLLDAPMLFGGNFTVTAWVKPAAATNGGTIFSVMGQPSGSLARFFSLSTSGVVSLVGTGSTLGWTGAPADGNWAFYAFTMDAAGNALLYYNGVLQQTTVSNFGIPRLNQLPLDTYTSVAIGKDLYSNSTAGTYFTGAIANVQVVPSVLSPIDIQLIAAGQPCAAQPMPPCWRAEHYWPLAPSTGTADTVGGLTASIVGPATGLGSSGGFVGTNSMAFNGSNFISVSGPIDFGGAFTVTAWAQPATAAPSTAAGAIFSVSGSVGTFTFGLSGISSTVRVMEATSAVSKCFGGPTPGGCCRCSYDTCASNCWGFYAVTVDATGYVSWWYNGALQGTWVSKNGATISDYSPTANYLPLPLARQAFTTVTIGKAADAAASASGFVGAIANVQIIPSVLSALDIAYLSSGMACSGPTMVSSPPPPSPPPSPAPPVAPPGSATALTSCWRASHVWALDSVTGITDTRTGVTSATVGAPLVGGVRSDLTYRFDSTAFSGSNYIAVGDLTFGKPFTLAVWAQPSNLGTIFSANDFGFSAAGVYTTENPTTVRCASGGCCTCSTNVCASNCWIHYAVTVDQAGILTWYANGNVQSMTFNYDPMGLFMVSQRMHSNVRIGDGYIGALAMLQIIPSVLGSPEILKLARGEGCLGAPPSPPPAPRRPPPLPPPPSPPPPPPSPPLNLVNLQAQLTSLAALVPPTCTSPSFLQRTASGWLCKAPVASLATASGWCQAAPSTGAVTCSAAAPQAASPGFSCLPPGGAWMGYNASAGWYCVCQPGWSGAACTTPAPLSAGMFCGAPPACATGQYAFVNGAFVCMQLACAPTADRVAQCAALGALYNATSGTVRLTTNQNGDGFGSSAAAWVNASLGITTDYCTFAGVLCASGTSSIIGLVVYGAVSGTIPPQLGTLTALKQLTISTSLISGTIPPQLGLLTALMSLFIDSNAALVGTVPASFGNLTQLNMLSLSGNQLCGAFPPGLVAICSSLVMCYTRQLPSCVASPPPPPLPPPVAVSPGGVLLPPFPPPLPPPLPPSPGVVASSAFTCTQQDAVCLALGALYASAAGTGWTNTAGWSTASAGTATSYCTFSGVSCTSGAVTTLCVPAACCHRTAH